MGALREGGAIHTEGDWFAGKGSWVATANPIEGEIGRDNDPYYGGHLIGESISSCNIPIISAAPDMFKALLAVKHKLHFVGMPGEKVCKVTGKPDWSDEITLIEAALVKAVTRVQVAPVPAAESEVVDAEFEVLGQQKPPLGLMPRKIWLEQRRDGIYDTIARCRAAGKDVNSDWLNELVDLEYDLQEVLSAA